MAKGDKSKQKKHKKHGKAQKQGKRGGKSRKTEAQLADRHLLYQKSVQEPDPDVDLIRRVYKRHNGVRPRLLREDFCGTAHFAARWVERDPEARAFGIDIDPEPLQWGREHNVGRLKLDQQSRIKLIEGDVRDVGPEKVDVTVAFNFSYFIFETRPALLDYFRRARAGLLPHGILFLDAYGGAEAQQTSEEDREVDGFTYVWDQNQFDPISHHCVNYIHFEFDDGSELRKAFSYEWRLWSLPELRELLLEAGFRDVEVYWEGTDHETGEGNGVFTKRERVPDDPAWVCYLAALQ